MTPPPSTPLTLLAAATAVREMAYAPYSRFRVGAALLRHGVEAAAELIRPTDLLMDAELLRGGRA